MGTPRYRLVNAISGVIVVGSGIFGMLATGATLERNFWGKQIPSPAASVLLLLPAALLGMYVGFLGGFFGIVVPLHYYTGVPLSLEPRQMRLRANVLAKYSRVFATVARKSRQFALWRIWEARRRPRMFPWGSIAGFVVNWPAVFAVMSVVKEPNDRTLSMVAAVFPYFALTTRWLLQHRLAPNWWVDVWMVLAAPGLFQFVLYGMLIDKARLRGKGWKVGAVLAALHIVAVALYFVRP